jgi:hypothetical protein
MSRKVFTAGEVLAAADVNSFLMDQTVMSFAGTAARGSAIGTATEGMVSFLEDSNLLSIYDGSAWKTSLATTGTVLQTVYAITSTPVTSTSTSYADTGLTATITPKATSSIILAFIDHGGNFKSAGNNSNSIYLQLIYPDASSQTFTVLGGYTNSSVDLFHSCSYVGSFTNTSTTAKTFKTQFASQNSGQTVRVQASNNFSSIVLMEIAN